MQPFSRDLSGYAATAIDEAIASLARGVRGAKGKILDLRGYRNVAIPFISRLPDETLAEFFILFEHQHREDCFSSRSHDEPICTFDWLVITHVCRRWRTIARALPHLWSHVPMAHDDELIEMFLKLSKGVPISVIPGTTADDDTLQAEMFYLYASLIFKAHH